MFLAFHIFFNNCNAHPLITRVDSEHSQPFWGFLFVVLCQLFHSAFVKTSCTSSFSSSSSTNDPSFSPSSSEIVIVVFGTQPSAVFSKAQVALPMPASEREWLERICFTSCAALLRFSVRA